MNFDESEKLYNLYGFETREKSENYIVFLFSHGYFRNVEVLYSDNFDITLIEEKYRQLKFPVNSVRFESIDKLHDNLFDGFFLVSELSSRLSKQYKQFIDERIFFDDDYTYIPCSYYKDNRLGTENIIDFLFDKIASSDSSLTILEAAAGYGKTCSVFELMNTISLQNNKKFVPLFIELSKNRNARIFKYVLLDEIDRNFSSLSSELVISEIKSGRVPLIIDGFDELLSSFEEDKLDDNIVDNAQTMLDTIVELLQDNSKAKIIITSRKTSLISGKVLDSLILKLDSCPISRITLLEPKIDDWLDVEKTAFLKKQRIPLIQFSNPILLKLLQKTNFSEFTKEQFSIKKILEENFTALLKREITRQQLQLSENEQTEIFEKFAAYLIDFQISSEDSTFIYDIFKEILGDKIPEFLARYVDVKSRPNENEFISKLTRHALLDTNKAMDKQIGFINDFIFGLYLAKAVINGRLQENIQICKDHVDRMCTTYKVMPSEDKNDLFNKLIPHTQKYDEANLLQIDSQIKGELSRNYSNTQIDGMIFENFSFSSIYIMNQCIFSNCTFTSCTFGNNLSNCQFMDCSFYNILTKNESEKFIYGLGNFFFNCTGIDVNYSKTFYEENEPIPDTLEKKVLEQFWCPGRTTYDKRKHPKTLFRGFSQSEYKSVSKAIDNLKKRRLLQQTSYCLELNIDKINEIREILGRIRDE